jgi:predicted sugar kinase
MFPVRTEPVFARMLYARLPSPDVAVVLVIPSQLESLNTLPHAQPPAVVTVILPVVALELVVSVVWDNVKLFGEPSSEIANAGGVPFKPVTTVMLAVRDAAQRFAATV